jgi:hypothetical protein
MAQPQNARSNADETFVESEWPIPNGMQLLIEKRNGRYG